MFDTILSVITGGATTGILGVASGLIGGIATAFTNIKMAKLKMQADKEKRVDERALLIAETAAMIKENEAGIKKVVAEGDAKEKIAEAAAYAESQKRAAKPLFHQSYMGYLMSISERGKWYSFMAGWTVYFICLGFATVDMIKSTVRPVLTYYVMYLATWVAYTSYDILKMDGVVLTEEQAYKLFFMCVNIILYLAVTAFTWYFCDRRTAKFINKQLEGMKL